MNKIKSLLFLACTVLGLLAGCAETKQYKAIERVCTVDLARDRVMKAAEAVLCEMYFTIEKADAERGYIKTRPLRAKQFFEFWRSDNIGAFNGLEANLHSIRRIVELNVTQREGKLCIGCDVKTQRLNLPQRDVSSSSQAYRMFSKSNSSIQILKLYPEQKRAMAWVDLGADEKLETEILKRIEGRIARQQKEKEL